MVHMGMNTGTAPTTTFVRLVECEYDCSLCGMVHRYTDGTDYDLHRDLMTGNRRWTYEEIAE